MLAQDPCQDEASFSRCHWEYILPQLSHAIPSVNAAAAAFGGFYESRLIPNSSDQAKLLAKKQYNMALQTSQQHISSKPHGAVPLLLAFIMLASAELMQRRQYNALIHLQGAFKILSASGRLNPTSSAPARAEQNICPGTDSDNLDLLFRCKLLHAFSDVRLISPLPCLKMLQILSHNFAASVKQKHS